MGTINLYWIPLGAGGHVVRLSGKLFEACTALLQRRPPCDLYHAALQIMVPEGWFVIEQAPVIDRHGETRGVVVEGPVGTRWAGRFRVFRYEVRRWRDGWIPDVDQAVASPVRLAVDLELARRVLELVATVPAPVWGRDQLGTGEMWNSNSIVAWVLARGGIDLAAVRPPRGGRAPGWDAGRRVAAGDQGPREPVRLTSVGDVVEG